MNRVLKQAERAYFRANDLASCFLQKSLIACVLGFTFSAQATPVEIYSVPVAVAGDGTNQVETLGLFKYAYCGYNSGGAGNLTVTGKEGKSVTFVTSTLAHLASTSGLGSDIGFSPNASRAQRDGGYEPVTGLTGNYRLALRDLYFVNLTPYTCAVTLKNLTAGRTYLVQVWGSDGYGSGTDRQVTYKLNDGADENSVQIDLNDTNANKGKGQVMSFKAVAESTTMVLTMNAAVGTFAGFSAIQVRDITPMYWTIASGNWNTTGTNWDPATDSEIIWNASTGAVVNAYFTNNATATLTSDVWARDVNVLSNTTIRRTSSGTTTLTVMRNLQVDADRTLTLGTGTANQATVLAVSNAVTGAGTVSIKNDSRVVLGKNAVGSANASIVGDGQDYRGAIQSIDNGNAEWSGQITCVNLGEVPRLGAGYNSVLTVSGKVTGNTLAIRSEADASPVGVVMLSNPGNDYTGDTTIYTPLRLGCANAIPLDSKWSFSFVANGNSSVDMNGFDHAVQSFNGTATGSNITNSSVTASVLTVTNSVAQTASVLRVTGNLSVVKRGVASLTLGATNTYSGTTTIQSGTLALTATGEINSTAKLILAGGTLDLSEKTGYIVARPLQVITNSSLVGTLTMGATSEVLFDGTSAALAGGTIAMAGQTLKLATTATLATGNTYPLISGYVGAFPVLDVTGLAVPDGATASLVLSGGLLSLSVVAATTDTSTTLTTDPAETGVYGTNIIITATVSPAGVPDGSTVYLYAAADLNTVIKAGVLVGGQTQFTMVKPAAGAYSYVAKFLGADIYRPSQSSASSSVIIQQKTLTISNIEVDKLFDGTTNVAPRFVTTGVVSGEPNPVTCAGYYEDAAPGVSKAVALVWTMTNPNYVLSGNDLTDAGNVYEYALWSGGASDGLWHSSGNWDHGIVPNNIGVEAVFNGDATVALSSGVSIKKLTFNGDVTLNGSGTFTLAAQYSTGEVVVAYSKTATFNALINSAWEGVPKKGLGTLVLVGNHGFGGKLDVQEGVVEINQTTAGALMYRDYAIAEHATLRFVCAAIGSAGTQLSGGSTRSVTGDGAFEVVSGYLRVQSDANKVNMSMSQKGQIIVRNGAKMDNSNAGGNRYAANKAKLNVEATGYYGLNADAARFGSLYGAGEVKADWNSQTLTITGDSDGTFAGTLTEKDSANRLSLTKSGLGTQILSGANSYTGATTINGGRLTLAGGDNRLSVNTQVTVTNAVFNLGMTQQTLNNNPVFRSDSKLAVDVSKTDIGRLTLTNSVDVSGWRVTINNPNDYPKGKRFAVISTGTDKIITGAPTLVDMPSGFIIYKQDNAIYVDSPAMIIFFK